MSDPSNDCTQSPVPRNWRPILKSIADALIQKRVPSGPSIRPVDPRILEINAANVADYPDPIGPLQEVAWTTSVSSNQGDHWEVLVDLSTSSGKTSDLVLEVKVFRVGEQLQFQPRLIFVP